MQDLIRVSLMLRCTQKKVIEYAIKEKYPELYEYIDQKKIFDDIANGCKPPDFFTEYCEEVKSIANVMEASLVG